MIIATTSDAKNYEGSEILFHLQANKLACYSFVDETWDSWVRDKLQFTTHRNSNGQRINIGTIFPNVNSHGPKLV